MMDCGFRRIAPEPLFPNTKTVLVQRAVNSENTVEVIHLVLDATLRLYKRCKYLRRALSVMFHAIPVPWLAILPPSAPVDATVS